MTRVSHSQNCTDRAIHGYHAARLRACIKLKPADQLLVTSRLVGRLRPALTWLTRAGGAFIYHRPRARTRVNPRARPARLYCCRLGACAQPSQRHVRLKLRGCAGSNRARSSRRTISTRAPMPDHEQQAARACLPDANCTQPREPKLHSGELR
ncbi:hypothetical protein T492DRAFT_371805 [Pavlovales sp. CCMP2436]|nr:hypothetical protein T492DRAFT_371805 [Pavlovales sp. CCMP2436]